MRKEEKRFLFCSSGSQTWGTNIIKPLVSSKLSSTYFFLCSAPDIMPFNYLNNIGNCNIVKGFEI